MPQSLHNLLLNLCHAEQVSFAELAAAETEFCQLQANAVKALLTQEGVTAEQIHAIGSHGQTIEHPRRPPRRPCLYTTAGQPQPVGRINRLHGGG